jgi:hypothetical protein
MNQRLHRTSRLLVAAALLAAAVPAHAVLQDHGPASAAAAGFPAWYRAVDGTVVEPCLAQTPSPNAAAGGAPMCFPLAPDPLGFAGNIGPEVFYADANNITTGPSFTARYTAALEAAYLSGSPQKGQEILFARIRIVISATRAGTYVVTHPYGVEVFPNVEPGARAVFFTEDVLPIVGNFDAALAGRIGPFLQWDVLNPGETLTVGAEQYLGDPNYAHTVTGSPFGTNLVRVQVLDAAGAVVETSENGQFNIVGKRYTTPIPTPLRVARATYSRDAVVTSIDVQASASAAQNLVATGAGMPSMQLKADGTRYMAHAQIPSNVIPPGQITVTNLTDPTLNSASTGVSDEVTISLATFDPSTNVLTVAASSSDQLAPPGLDVVGFVPGTMSGGLFTTQLLSGVPPLTVSVVSSAGGTATLPVHVLATQAGNPANPPVATDDAVTANSGQTVSVAVTANDAPVNPATIASVIILTRPTQGAVRLNPLSPLTVDYTAAAGASGADAFTYLVQDSTGALSNVGTVRVTLTFVAPPPTANADATATQRGTTRLIDVLANDVAGPGTSIDPATLAIATPPAQGTATVVGGKISYAANPTFTGTVTFTYTVANGSGTVSAPATVNLTVFPNAEILSALKPLYTTAQKKWVITGQSSWLGPNFVLSVSCYNGVTVQNGTTLIGTGNTDNTGKFTVAPPVPSPVAPDASKSITCVSQGLGKASSGVSVK